MADTSSRHLKSWSRKFRAFVAIGVILLCLSGYVCVSFVLWDVSVADFRRVLQKDGFEVISAGDFLGFRDFMFLPPEMTIHCQNESQFIYEAQLANSTGFLAGSSIVYLLNNFHFYAITSDNQTGLILGYEYTPPLFRI